MKTKLFVLIAVIALVLAGCAGGSDSKAVDAKAKGEVAERSVASTDYTVDTQGTTLLWTGSKSFTGDEHKGTINVTSGNLSVANGKLTAGEFAIDMASIASTDGMDEEKTGMLVGHLASPDFFDVANHPKASFEITAVEDVAGDAAITHKISGNLTLRGVTKEITIPAKVNIVDGAVMATSEFTFDRSDFGVNYGSSKIDVNLVKDKVISDDIKLNLNLVAKTGV